MTANTTIPFSYPREATLVEFSLIRIKDDRTSFERSREDFSHVQELADNISKYGLIHPPLLSAEHILVAGECRIRAMQLLQTPLFPVLYRENLTPSEVAELELMENLKRRNFKWQETVLNMRKVHKLKFSEGLTTGKEWLQSETGALFGYHRTYVGNALRVADLILAGDKELLEANGIKEAFDILKTRALNRAVAEKALRTSQSLGLSTPTPLPSSGAYMINLDGTAPSSFQQLPSLPESERTILTDLDGPKEVSHAPVENTVDFSQLFIFGDSIEVMRGMSDKSVDCIVTDPPYGIDMANLDTNKDLHRTVNEHGVEENLELLPRFLEQAFRVLKDDSFCVFWYDMEHHQKLVDWAEGVGFDVQRWPLIWVKTHPCRNSAPFHNYTKATEAAMVCRKGKPKLKKPMVKNYIMADGMAERKMYDHPFIKPRDVWNFILEGVAFAGQTILDPFAGQMSCPRAVLNAGMRPLAIEKNPYHFVQGVGHMEKLFKEMTLNKCNIINDPRGNIPVEAFQPELKPVLDSIQADIDSLIA